MPLLHRRDPNKPRITIRERLRCATARIMPRSTGQHRKGGGRVRSLAAATVKILHFPKRNRASAVHPDQVLLEWGAKYDAQRAVINSWPDEDEEGCDAQSAVLDDIERVIASMKPKTLDGLAIKARVAEMYAGRLTGPPRGGDQEVALASLVDSVLSLAEKGPSFPATQSDDHELISMAAEWKAGFKKLSALYDDRCEAEERYSEMEPYRPRELRATQQDYWTLRPRPEIDMQTLHSDPGHLFFTDAFVGKLRSKPIMQRHAGKSEYRPWPQAQARADQVIAAWDRWQAEVQAAKDASGLTAVDAAVKECSQRLLVLEGRITRARAKTLPGLIAKARMAGMDPVHQAGLSQDLEEALANRTDTAEIVGLSLAIDLLNIAGEQA